ncbi:ESAT-6 like protein 13 esxF [Mycobacterium tuberculosis]|nr:ESAT-6 like protein 13 esxF [Mycobacterium tuberculosis]
MGADDTLRVEPAVMQGFAASLDGAAEHLAVQLAELDAQVGQMLGGWRGASGSAYGSAGSYGIAGPVRCSWDCRCWRRR